MNKKRWIAVLIAAGLLVVSLVSSSLTSNSKEEKQMSGLNSLLMNYRPRFWKKEIVQKKS